VVMIFVGDWLREDVGKRWVATPAQGDRLILSTYNTRKCMIEEGFICDVLGWLQLFQFIFVYFLCDIMQCIVCLSHIVFPFFGRNLVGFYFDFVRLYLT